MKKLLLVALVATLAAGCAVGPKFRNPGPVVPAAWQSPLPHEGQPAQLVGWWKQLNDPLLTELVATAEANNPSLDSALARMKEARANSWLEFANLSPSGTANAEIKRSRSLVGFDNTGPITGVSKFKDRSLDAAWEIDLFGGQRRALEAARRRAFAAESQWHDARTTLAAEVANTYTGLRACEARLQLQQAAAASPLLRILRPVLGLLFGEAARRRRAATLLLQGRGTGAFGRWRLGWAWRAAGPAGLLGAARTTCALALRDVAALALTLPAQLLFRTVVLVSRAVRWLKARVSGGAGQEAAVA
jgi:hypothetical protein